ncbi:MAG: L,D-transpeptidase [Nannocystaceae bacterium]
MQCGHEAVARGAVSAALPPRGVRHTFGALNMDARRIFEMLGAFLLGGGLVAVAYELGMDAGSRPGGGAAQSPAAASPESVESALHIGGGGQGRSDPELAPSTGSDRTASAAVADVGTYVDFPKIYAPATEMDAAALAKFPKHGLVTSGAITVRERPELAARRLGLLRAATRVRVHEERTYGGGCSRGWRGIFPRGWVCLNAGLDTGSSPPDDGLLDIGRPDITEAMPYDYWRVSHDTTPVFHRLPSYGEQDRADKAGAAWKSEHGRMPMPTHPQKRPDDVPAVVKEYLNGGYYVTVASEHVKSKRHFLRTNRGLYARKYQMEQRDGSTFRGVLLPSTDALPVHWIIRELPLMKRKSPGSGILDATTQILERRSRHLFKRTVRVGDQEFYEDENGLLLRAYAVGKAYKLKRPPGVTSSEHWIHVDLSEQTLVAYIGDRPVFTTIVSTGKEAGMTPVGVFRIQSKFVATSMRDQPVEDEAYSIEDVPWTQYFHNNVALHGAFWHGGFGLVRSHGCVNVSPADARWLFGFTEPLLPHSWHAVMPGVGPSGQGSAVVVTP